MKKALAFVLLSVLFTGVFVSCSSNNTTSTVTPTVTPQVTPTVTPQETENITPPMSTEPVISDKLQQAIDNKTFSGKTVNFVMSGDKLSARSIAVDRNAEDYDPDYSMNVAVDKRNMTVERDLGITVNLVDTLSPNRFINYMQTHIYSPEKDIDIVGAHQWFDLGLAYGENSGSLISFEQLDKEGKNYLNPSAVYWDKEAYINASFKGEHYWITGDLSQKWVSSIYVSFVNVAIWEEYAEQIKGKTGNDNIYDLVASGDFTLDLVMWLNEQGAKTLLHSQDQLFNTTADALYSSAGFRLTQYNQSESELAKISLLNNEFKAFCEKTTEIYRNSEIFKISDNENNILQAFKNGKHLIAFATLGEGEQYLNDMSDYLILPLPKFYSDQARYYTSVQFEANHFGISSTCSDTAAATAALELLSYYSYKYVTPTYYSEAINGCYCGDSEGAEEMLYMARDAIYSDYAIFWSGNFGAGNNPLHYLRTKTGIEKMYFEIQSNRIEAEFQKRFDNHINSLKKSKP